jgi:hypothetical protein
MPGVAIQGPSRRSLKCQVFHPQKPTPFRNRFGSRMASATLPFGARLYAGISVTFLALWATTALGFVAFDLLSTSRNLVEPIASISLLTYLICRLYCTFITRPQ